jgi:hypothetical protein
MKVIITNTQKDDYCNYTWYNKGEVYNVNPYRHNPDIYWEIEGWDGNTSNFWIMKIHTKVINDYNLPEELFKI